MTAPQSSGGEKKGLPPADFLHFISGLAMQTLMHLGVLDNVIEGGRNADLKLARYSIDLLAMLEEKTRGNLTEEERRYLKAALSDLRMRYVEAATAAEQKPSKDSAGGAGDGTGGT